MKLSPATTLAALAGLIFSGTAGAIPTEVSDSPYAVIVTRNPFDLKPAPVEKPPEPPKPPPSNLELTGITTIFGRKQVLINIKEQNGTSKSKMLTIGESADDSGVEVISVDEAEGEVKVRNRGVETTLSFKANGAKVPSGPAPAPGAPVPGMVPPQASGIPAPGQAVPIPNSVFQDMRSSDPNQPGTRTIPTRSIRTPTTVPSPQPTGATPTQGAQRQTSVEEQMILMEINRALNQGGPPLPPTPLSQ